MNKKGITLVELLAVLAIIAILAAFIFPNMNKYISRSKNTTDEIQVANIKEAAKSYLADHIGSDIDFEATPTVTITLKQVVDGGYISGDILDSKSNKEYDLDNSTITITKEENNYTYDVQLNTK